MAMVTPKDCDQACQQLPPEGWLFTTQLGPKGVIYKDASSNAEEV